MNSFIAVHCKVKKRFVKSYTKSYEISYFLYICRNALTLFINKAHFLAILA